MDPRGNNVAYMRTYLKYAVEFEKYLYIWQNSMNTVNGQKQKTYDDQAYWSGLYLSSKGSLDNMNANVQYTSSVYSKEAEEKKKKLKFCNGLVLAAAVAALIFGILFTVPEGLSFFYSLIIAAVIALFVLPLPLILRSSAKSKYEDVLEKMNNATSADTVKMQSALYRSREEEAGKKMNELTEKMDVIEKQQAEIHKNLTKIKSYLKKHYSLNVLPEKYRSFNAVATLYEYLSTGRCNTIQGHGGIYDTYENDLRMGLIIQNLMDINSKLDDIRINQEMLYDEMQKANRSLNSINSSLLSIEKTNREIAVNTAISAEANKQTAEATRWMAWYGY